MVKYEMDKLLVDAHSNWNTQKKPFPTATECEWGQWCREYTREGFDFCCCCANQQFWYWTPPPTHPPPQKDSSTEPSVHSQCYHIHQHHLNDIWFRQHGDHCPHCLTQTVRRVIPPVTEKCHGHCDPPACQPEISCCGNIWQRECLHFTFPPLKTQKPTLGTRSRSHTETLCTGLWTTLQCDYSSILHRRVHNWIN
jgi:hypothetical protein